MARKRKKLGAVLVARGRPGLALTACGGGGGSDEGGGGGEGGAIDTSQRLRRHQLLAVGRQPAAGVPEVRGRFHAANPNINVKITQYGWDDYWTKLTNGFVAGDAPDVFTDHLSKYPEFVSQEQLVPLDERSPRTGSTSISTRRPGGPVEG